jgi:RimJ/RimL family protein N-acetyltransferase
MSGPELRGERVVLRPVTQEHVTPRYVGWLNDPETTRYLESGRIVETLESLSKYVARYEERPDALFLAIHLAGSGEHVGNVKLEPINRTHCHAVLGIMIGEAGARGKGIGGEAIRLVLAHAFRTMKLHRVALGVTSDNLPGIRCYQKLGFKEEGRFREAVLREHGYVDSIWMAILDREFRELHG